MAQRKRIALETEPHVYEIDCGPARGGLVELRFQPEVMSGEFVDAQQEFAEERERVQALEDRRHAAAESEVVLRRFVARFALPESAALLTDDVVKLPLPDWVLADLSKWVVELYGRRPTGSSSDSSPSPPTGGKASTAAGPSKGSTRTRGRSRG